MKAESFLQNFEKPSKSIVNLLDTKQMVQIKDNRERLVPIV